MCKREGSRDAVMIFVTLSSTMSISFPSHAINASHRIFVSSASILELNDVSCCALPDEATSGAISFSPAERERSARLPQREADTRGASSEVSVRPAAHAAAKAPAAPSSESAFCFANGSARLVGPSVSSSIRL